MSIPFFLLFLLTTLVVALVPLGVYWITWLLIPIIAGGGPYVPTKPQLVERMIKLAHLTPDDVTVDLGSGDGRIVIASAQTGARRSIGYEIYPRLVKLSRRRIEEMGLTDRAEIKLESMWDADLSNTTVIFLFQIPYALDHIRRLLETQLPTGARVISNDFKIPGWKPDLSEDCVHVYTIKDA